LADEWLVGIIIVMYAKPNTYILATDTIAFPYALIIDDEIDICFLLSNILKRSSFNVKSVNSLSAARDVLPQQQPQIVFIDNHLGDGLGIEYIPEIKKIYPDTKVVMITAYDDEASRSTAKQNGADDFIPKPLYTAAVQNALNTVSLKQVL